MYCLLVATDLAHDAFAEYPVCADTHLHCDTLSWSKSSCSSEEISLGLHTAGPVLVVVVPNTYEPSTSAVCSLMWEPYGGSLRLCYFGTTTT